MYKINVFGRPYLDADVIGQTNTNAGKKEKHKASASTSTSTETTE